MKQLFIGDVAQDSRQGHSAERSLDRLIIKAAGNIHTFQTETFAHKSADAHVAVIPGHFDSFFAVIFDQRIFVDSGPEAHGGFQSFEVGTVILFDGNVHFSNRLFCSERRENFLSGGFRSPAFLDRLSFDFVEFAVTDRFDLYDALTFALCGLQSHVRFSVDGVGSGSRSLNRCIFLNFGFDFLLVFIHSLDFSFEIEFCANCHFSRAVRANGND